MMDKLSEDRYYVVDVTTSFKVCKPFTENKVQWFDVGFAHVKCNTVKYWDFQALEKEVESLEKQLEEYKSANEFDHKTMDKLEELLNTTMTHSMIKSNLEAILEGRDVVGDIEKWIEQLDFKANSTGLSDQDTKTN